ncbi:4-hydroxy-tetrahydrodipicolinate synthase [bacterium]|nr:4-hydroxy-tetrahydrodipicolinate synthase [bacterium]
MAARKGEIFAGVTVAIITPFKTDESVDYAALKRIVDFHVEQGTDALAPVGTTGESPTLDHDEHRKVIETVVAHAAGRIKVMAGTGSNSTKEALELTQFAKDVGADGALIVGPYYNKPTQEGYRRHYLAIADAVELPQVIYNIPGRTASVINPETLIHLGEHPNIVAVKEATGSMDFASQLVGSSRLSVLSGDDSMTLPVLAVGGSGIVSVVGNIVPKDLQAVVNHFKAGRIAEAQAAHHKLFSLCKSLLTLATNPIPIKAAMKILGKDTGVLRLPMTPLDAGEETKLRRILSEYGLC